MSPGATEVPRPWDTWAPGIRVVLRRRLPDGHLGDVLGVLVAVDADHLVVRTRRGEVTVRRDDVVLGKPVPPPPAPRRRRAGLRTADDDPGAGQDAG